MFSIREGTLTNEYELLLLSYLASAPVTRGTENPSTTGQGNKSHKHSYKPDSNPQPGGFLVQRSNHCPTERPLKNDYKQEFKAIGNNINYRLEYNR